MAKTVGVDVGGTFTDVVCFDDETSEVRIRKVSSTPADPSIGLLRGLEEVGLLPTDDAVIVHGTTVATNAIIERKGATCGLITTRGFRDVVELRRRDRPALYGLIGDFEPLVPRDLRVELSERSDAEGRIIAPVDALEVRQLAERLRAGGAESVAVCLFHSYANPTNEQAVRQILEQAWPNEYITLSSEVLREFREFERTSTTVANAYIQPVMAGYLGSLAVKLRQSGHNCEVLLIQGNGGVMTLETARRLAVNTISSGPAAGVIAASAIAQQAGYRNLISCDMGGTSVDVCVVPDGSVQMRTDNEISYGIPVRVPMVDVHSVGAGGGSIAWIDRGGVLQVGPMSAGAEPGPACYGRGGREPTVTDAHLVLGRIPSTLAGDGAKGLRLDVGLSREAIGRLIAEPLGISIDRAAFAILELASNKIAGSLRRLSTERGHDPRRFALIPFGGAGPLHAMAVMQHLHIRTAIVPFAPGVTSALGCLMADHRHEFVQTFNRILPELDLGAVESVLSSHRRQGLEVLAREGITPEHTTVIHQAEVCYSGQTHTLLIPLAVASISREQVAETFERAYQRRYGAVLANTPILFSNLRTSVIGVRPKPELRSAEGRNGQMPERALREHRPVYFEGAFVSCPIYARSRLGIGSTIAGPAVVEQSDCTIAVEPGGVATVDRWGNLVLEVR